jgi:hypothetical protein
VKRKIVHDLLAFLGINQKYFCAFAVGKTTMVSVKILGVIIKQQQFYLGRSVYHL